MRNKKTRQKRQEENRPFGQQHQAQLRYLSGPVHYCCFSAILVRLLLCQLKTTYWVIHLGPT